ncbi:phage tail sheath subtilisin-like domain-containing protein [Paenibacillus sp. NPDC093718]|uniref:phage tail sheath subtilisin-like domain-containing protein n=1 Tax=Paenibacillus sp. NPDC093718 TaxID=3390601 RepID=UPI003D00BA9F
MGLPEIIVTFKSLAVSAVQRSQRGIVALILKDDTGTFDTKEYKSISEIESTDWTAQNLDYIQKTFLGIPSKVIVERLDADALDYNDALKRLKSKKWNYLAIPGIEVADVSSVSTWIKTERDVNKATYKAVLPNNKADHEGVINFTTEGITAEGKVYSASDYTGRIAGILAGLPFSRSATYYVLPEVEAITEIADPNEAIDAGELILVNDGSKIKIGRGVNSLTTTTVEKSADFKKIKIIEGMDLIKEDIVATFNDSYVGKVNNNYENQTLFLSSVNSYLASIEGDILDPLAENRVDVDVAAQRLAWESTGLDTTELTDQQIKEKSFQSKVFVGGSAKFLDAMEDLFFNINM